MLKTINYIFLLFMICFIYNQDINYEHACTNIYFRSKKDCSVAPWDGNKRCCYISYEASNGRDGECVFLNDTKNDLKAKINEYEGNGKTKVKIECCSYYLKNFIYSSLITSFIFFFLLF